MTKQHWTGWNSEVDTCIALTVLKKNLCAYKSMYNYSGEYSNMNIKHEIRLLPLIISDGFTFLVREDDFGDELLACMSSLLPNIEALSLTDNFDVSESYTIPLSIISRLSSV